MRLSALILLLSSQFVLAAPANIDSLRFWTAPDHTRLVFGTSSPVEHKIFMLANPARLVIDIEDSGFKADIPAFSSNHALIDRVRHGKRNKGGLRVVLDLKQTIKPKSFLLKPNSQYGHRLVVDLFPKKQIVIAETPKSNSANKNTPPKVVKSTKAESTKKKWVVAIDAGHGGEDPGAKGHRGTKEKEVVLSIAKKLAQQINQRDDMKAVLIRSGDYYVGLRQRMEKARQARADLFISIHADAFKDQRARGSSVYVLSNRGASSEAARWLAKGENETDLVGGVSLDDKSDVLASVLLDLSQNATKDSSASIAGHVLSNLKSVGHTHKRKVQHAGFIVLKSPDIPSILVETAFISNKNEETKLRDPKHQTKIARAILKGVNSYFSGQAPSSATLAQVQTYKIKKGDTLSTIAQRYQVSMRSIKKANAMKSSTIRSGQVIRIPS
ncbi:MAG: N-acetylmuramoyl-L-alanine amidase [Cycloclasticus sp. symbiont of Poecilosclerida sp. M]|nr:MAG: N-acetylmuramoyl-L-alanine amidase [Cycloclasticus sp. symbiont of Poecilosclerida sp. M]